VPVLSVEASDRLKKQQRMTTNKQKPKNFYTTAVGAFHLGSGPFKLNQKSERKEPESRAEDTESAWQRARGAGGEAESWAGEDASAVTQHHEPAFHRRFVPNNNSSSCMVSCARICGT